MQEKRLHSIYFKGFCGKVDLVPLPKILNQRCVKNRVSFNIKVSTSILQFLYDIQFVMQKALYARASKHVTGPYDLLLFLTKLEDQ